MEGWSNDFFQVLEAVATEIEQFCTEVAKEVNGVLDMFVEASEDMVEQVQQTFATEIERQISDFFDPILEAYLGFEIHFEETSQPLLHTLDPVIDNHPVCVGCRHYHGQIYGGNPLICGMHPFGWEGDQCPDWQSTWQE